MKDALAWMWINDHTHGNRLDVLSLIQELGSPQSLLNADLDVLTRRLDSDVARKLVDSRNRTDFSAYEEVFGRYLGGDIRLLTILDKEYPPLLKRADDPPLTLLAKGSLREFSNCVAVVGARNISSRGYRMARECARSLAEKGYTVVSGLARGTDTQAHIGALEATGRTVAVLPTSIDKIYPPENERLAEEIAKSGALVSEKALHRPVNKSDFVLRNRITSGMSVCLVIIESSGGGGTSAQIEYALDQGRRVFVLMQEESEAEQRRGFVDFVGRGAEPFKDTDELASLIKNLNYEVEHRENRVRPGTLDEFLDE